MAMMEGQPGAAPQEPMGQGPPQKGGGEFGQMVGAINKSLVTFAEALASAGAPKEVVAQAQDLVGRFQGLVKSVAGGGAPQGAKAEQPMMGQSTPEQGGADTRPM